MYKFQSHDLIEIEPGLIRLCLMSPGAMYCFLHITVYINTNKLDLLLYYSALKHPIKSLTYSALHCSEVIILIIVARSLTNNGCSHFTYMP